MIGWIAVKGGGEPSIQPANQPTSPPASCPSVSFSARRLSPSPVPYTTHPPSSAGGKRQSRRRRCPAHPTRTSGRCRWRGPVVSSRVVWHWHWHGWRPPTALIGRKERDGTGRTHAARGGKARHRQQQRQTGRRPRQQQRDRMDGHHGTARQAMTRRVTHQVVEGDGVDGAEVVEAVLEGGVVPVPRHHVEGGAGQGSLVHLPREFVELRVCGGEGMR